MSTTERTRPVTASEVARKLLERPAASESLTTKQNARGDIQVELQTVRQEGESMYDWHLRHTAAYDAVTTYYRELQIAAMPERDNGTPLDD